MTASPVPLTVEARCSFCEASVLVALVAVESVTEVSAVLFRAEWKAHHRCPAPDPWEDVPPPSAESLEWAIPKPRTDEP